MRFNLKEWEQSYYRFENGDGTQYTVHLAPCEHGGIYMICNDSSLWMGFDNLDYEIKFLCGINNEYTKRAMAQILKFHYDERVNA